MVKNYKKLSLVIAAFAANIIFAGITNATTNTALNSDAVNSINEDSYNIVIDLKAKTANVDGKTKNLTDLLKLDQNTVNQIVADGSIADILEQQSLGTVTKKDSNQLVYYNNFSLNSLIVALRVDTALEKYSYTSKENIFNNYYAVFFDNAKDTEAAYKAMQNDGEIKNVALDTRSKVSSIRSSSWGTEAVGADHYTDWLEMSPSTGVRQVTVAVLDSGINKKHEAFSGRLVLNEYAKDYVNDDDDITDDLGHGTAVAGAIVTSTPENVKILPIKIADEEGYVASNSIILRTLYHLADENAADIANLSFGMDLQQLKESSASYTLYETMLGDIQDKGLIMVAAAGNECYMGEEQESDAPCPTDISWPADSTHTIAASAVSRSYDHFGNDIRLLYNECNKSPISSEYASICRNANLQRELNYIRNNNLMRTGQEDYFFDYYYSNHSSRVDFAMPGSNLSLPNTCDEMEGSDYTECRSNPDAFYTEIDGTSFSAPFLSAAISLILSDNPSYNFTSIYNELKTNAVDYGPTGKDEFYGWGMVDFGAKKFNKPQLVVNKSTYKTATKTDSITVGIVSSKPLTHTGYTTSSTNQPTWESTPTTYSASIDLNLDAKTQKTYYIWARNDAGATNRISYTTSQSSTPDPDPDPSSSSTDIEDGIYIIHSLLDHNKVIDLSGGSTANGSNIHLWNNNGTYAQKYIIQDTGDDYYKIENLVTQKVLDVAGGGTANGTNVWQHQYNGTCAQKWSIEKDGSNHYTFVSACSGKVLDVAGGGTANGTNIWIYQGNNTAAQKFNLEQVEKIPNYQTITSGTYRIHVASNPYYVFDIAGGSTANGGNLQIYQQNNTPAQDFYITAIGNGFYRIRNSNSGKVLDIAGGSMDYGANVQQFGWNGTAAQQWLIKDQGGGRYSFISRCNGNALDVQQGTIKNASNIWSFLKNNTPAQMFTLEKRY